MGTQQAPGWWDAHLGWVPLHLQEPEHRSGLLWGGSLPPFTRGVEDSISPALLPFLLRNSACRGVTGFFFFFFPPLSGIGFHFLHSQCLCLRRDAAEGTHLRGEGTGLGLGIRGTACSQHRFHQRPPRWGAESARLGMSCRVGGHIGHPGGSRDLERSLSGSPLAPGCHAPGHHPS